MDHYTKSPVSDVARKGTSQGTGGSLPLPKTVLVVDDSIVNRTFLRQILEKNYTVLTAGNGQIGWDLLQAHAEEIAAVILDLMMPVMDGYGFLDCVQKNPRFRNLPVIVITGSSATENEIQALALGAWDFVSKPYAPEIINFRLQNAIDRSQLTAFAQLKYLAEYDALTGIFHKTKFFEMTRVMIDSSRKENFVLIRFDVDRFQLINSFFGTAEGDRLLVYIAAFLRAFAVSLPMATYGRMESDIFCLCMPYDPGAVITLVHQIKQMLVDFNPNYDIVPSIGIYVIDDPALPAETMYNRATLAAKVCKGSYMTYYSYYDASMSLVLEREQEIVNEMKYALEHHQFEVYLQPKYSIQTNLPCGAEALARWLHPKKGFLSPAEFIPIFERNGFISRLDYYVWEQVCGYLRSWLDSGATPYPISVNVSRVNLYNPNLAELLIRLVEKYQLEPALLQLELTESAYTDNPAAASETISHLQSHGFIILMDDFGSGYSSLNILKDIAVDVLKLDMRFLSKTKIPGRGENIVASVIRMAKWLDIPVITEGVETAEQVEFLRSVGCDYVQGFYFAHPMPVADYEALCSRQNVAITAPKDHLPGNYRYDALFASSPDLDGLFDNVQLAAALYEYSDDKLEVIRVNDAYTALLGYQDMEHDTQLAEEGYWNVLIRAFKSCAETHSPVSCEYIRRRVNGTALWIETHLAYLSNVGDRHILIGTLNDVTLKKEIDRELQHYRSSLLSHHSGSRTILIVDDAMTNRIILRKIFENQFHLLEAGDGEAALQILMEKKDEIDLILLDIVMPKMDGKTFLENKRKVPAFDSIPVIMITADDSPAQQVSMLSLGANDYIVKPFIPEMVVRRVKNVLGFNRHFKEMIQEYNTMSERVKTDPMTGLLNRVSAEAMITQALGRPHGLCAMLMLDIDNFKKLNDTRSHVYGDKVICAVAHRLQSFFRQNDIVARMGGDEFAVFIDDVPSEQMVERKAHELCKALSALTIDGVDTGSTCSIGLAVSQDATVTFETLYQNADKALYNAKCSGKSCVSLFGKEIVDSTMKWVGDAEGILNDMQNGVYVCDSASHELLYINDYVCTLLGTDRKGCLGQKCYEILLQRTEPCGFCPISQLDNEQPLSRFFPWPSTSRTLLMQGKKINWNGTPAYLELTVDVADMGNLQALYEEPTRNGSK